VIAVCSAREQADDIMLAVMRRLTSIEDIREQLAEACRRHHVARLELFGSAARGGFDPASSDYDLLVEFLPLAPLEHYEAYFGLLEALDTMLGRKVDLVELRAVRNPYFLQSVNEDRMLLYAA
jgi:predicted nucleotidyltransferase